MHHSKNRKDNFMSITLVYIPKKLKSFDMLQEDIRKDIIEKAIDRVDNYKDEYEDFEQDIPDVKETLNNMWKTLINDGYITESDTGYYNADEDFYHCPILQCMILLLSKLDFIFDSIEVGRDECSGIININSKKYREKIRIPQ